MHSASVTVDQKLISQIGKGILVFAAVSKEDSREDVESMAAKVLKMRMWDDDDGGKVTCPRPNTGAILTASVLQVEEECSRRARRSALWYARALQLDTPTDGSSLPIHFTRINQKGQ